MDDDRPTEPDLARWRRVLSWSLIGLATLLLVFAIASIWVKRQALDDKYWRDTSGDLVENEQIRNSVANYLVDQLFDNVDVAGELSAALPPRLQPLAGPAAGGLRELATRAANRALENPRVQNAWVEANALTHDQFVDLIENKKSALQIHGGAVVLNLAPLITQLANRVGIGADISAKLPAGVGQISVLKSDQVDGLQKAVRLLKGLVIVLGLLVPILFAIAVLLVPGRRRRALLGIGLGILATGLLVTLLRNVAGDEVVNALSSTPSVEPTAQATWDISTSLLGDMALYTTLFGIAVLFAYWLSGSSRPATALRRAAAPTLRDRPELAWGSLAALLLLFLVVVNIPATRKPYGVLLIVILACVALEALRRQTAREFPDAAPTGFIAGLRDSWRGGTP